MGSGDDHLEIDTGERMGALATTKSSAYVMGRSAPYVEGLLFQPAEEGAGDPDEAMISGSMARQTVEKVKDVVTKREESDTA